MYSKCYCRLISVSHQITIKRLASNKFLKVLEEKELLKEWLPQNRKEEMFNFLKKEQTIYAGFDPTGPSLHVGNLLVIMTLIHALRSGHRVICLIGDGTAKIGDPSGKENKREIPSEKEINENAARISASLCAIFANHLKHFWKSKNSSPIYEPIIVNNLNWYEDMSLIDFLSEIGTQVGVRNLSRKSFVEDRQHNLTFSQFSYQVMQAFDWLRLYDKHGCRFQIGGSDQLHNIEAGFTLIRNTKNDDNIFGLLLPLLTDKDGKKMGKTEGKSLFLDKFINSPYSFYKALLKLPHSQMRKFLQYFTFYDNQEIEGIIQKDLKKQSLYAQKKLAETLTLLIHGESGLNQAKNAAAALLFGEFDALNKLTEDDLIEVFGSNNFITCELEPKETCLLDVIKKTKCFHDEQLAVTMIAKGGVMLNTRKITKPSYLIKQSDVLSNNLTIIQIGTTRAYFIRWL